ncbi:hypothetical protein K4F52_010043 [Lecanicillium sp. MT-2017a]|nr:hypothetical protein K4F52_010043 [Lecanicillium sp. MT-2017a]
MACHTPAATSDHRSGSSTGQAPAVSDPIYISSDEESGLDENLPTAAIAASATKGCRKTSIGISSQGSCTSPRTASNRLNSPPASTHHMPLGSLPSVAVSASLSPVHNQCPSPRSALSAEREASPSRDEDSPHASHRASFGGPEIPVLINTHLSMHANAAEQGSTLAVSASQDRLMRDEGAADSITSTISTEETRHSTESVRLVDVHQREVSPDDSAYRPPSSPSMSVLVHKALSPGKPGPVSLATDPATSVGEALSTSHFAEATSQPGRHG